ncbi:hypothetical protein CCMA1212_002619 [Trichoderma ghanense]|uniref:Uncharacterized protein n=1 Tax=Trichoderma ghanense TaxID=65468 RepID=A0ABY2HBJ4_9HYPO
MGVLSTVFVPDVYRRRWSQKRRQRVGREEETAATGFDCTQAQARTQQRRGEERRRRQPTKRGNRRPVGASAAASARQVRGENKRKHEKEEERKKKKATKPQVEKDKRGENGEAEEEDLRNGRKESAAAAAALLLCSVLLCDTQPPGRTSCVTLTLYRYHRTWGLYRYSAAHRDRRSRSGTSYPVGSHADWGGRARLPLLDAQHLPCRASADGARFETRGWAGGPEGRRRGEQRAGEEALWCAVLCRAGEGASRGRRIAPASAV